MVRKEPQNIEAEISVLGCGFLEKSAFIYYTIIQYI